MAFELSVDDKDRDERLSVAVRWPQIIAAGSLTAGNHGFEADVYGRQATKVALRTAGTVGIRFIRLPSGDTFAWGTIYVDPSRPDWYGVLTADRVVNVEKWGAPPWSVGVQIDTRVPYLVLRNRILIAAKLP